MPARDIYSKRQRRARGEMPDVYTYDDFPRSLRVQLVQLIRDGIGDPNKQWSDDVYRGIHEILCREYGVFSLFEERQRISNWEALANTLLRTEDHERILDIVEMCLDAVDGYVRENQGAFSGCVEPDAVIAEVNVRFKEHGVGYEFASGNIVRIDSQLVHEEVVKPALHLLADPQYAGANAEFLSAHEHYRHQRYSECINECLKAFESTMKVICTKRGWAFDERRDGASALIQTCMGNGLFPNFLQTHIGGLRSILESGLPTTRNRQSGHGQGAEVTEVTEATASFALHTTATNIVFFARAEQELPS